MGKSSGSIWVSLGLRTADFSKGISKAKKSLNGFQKFGQGLKGMFNPMTIGIGIVAGLGAALTGAVGIFKDFQKANSELEAVLGATDKEMASLSKQAKNLGASTAFTATEVAGLQKSFAKLGFDSSQIENMTEATLNLAAAAGVELAEAADFAGATLNAFGLQSTDAAHVTDVMAASFAMSALDMTKLSETMKQAAPIARATGVSFETAAAAAGKLADANISGSQAGTALKRIFSELVKDGKPFEESLNDIAKEMDAASTKAEKLAIAERKVGNIAKGSLLVLVQQKDALGELSEEFLNANGTAKRMADTMLDNLAGSITIATSAYEGFILSIEDGEGPISKAIESQVKGFTGILNVLTNLNKGFSFIDAFKKVRLEADGLVNAAKRMEETPLHAALEDKAFELAAQRLGMIAAGADQTGKEFLLLEAKIKKVNEALGIKEEVMPDVKENIGEVTQAVKVLTKAEVKAAKEIAALKAEYGGLEPIIGKTITEIDRQSNSIGALTERIKRLKDAQQLEIIGSLEFRGLQDEIAILQEKLDLDPALGLSMKIKVGIQPIAEEEREALNAQFALIEAQANAVGGAVANAFNNMSNSMINSMGLASSGMEGFLGGILSTVTSLISMMLAAAISQSISGATSSGTATGPAAVFTTPAFIATAVAGVIGAFAAIPAFADGGLVTGPSMGLVGEGKGTTRSNPEVIAPLDKLKGFMPDGGGMGGPVEFLIKGTNLVGVLERTNKSIKFSR